MVVVVVVVVVVVGRRKRFVDRKDEPCLWFVFSLLVCVCVCVCVKDHVELSGVSVFPYWFGCLFVFV